MNQGRIWCVVKPTVGLPLFLGSVATTALIVHYSILSHTTWFSGYWNGGAKKSAATESTQPLASDTKTGEAAGVTMSVTPVAAANGTTQFVITVAPKAGDATPQTVALAPPDPK